MWDDRSFSVASFDTRSWLFGDNAPTSLVKATGVFITTKVEVAFSCSASALRAAVCFKPHDVSTIYLQQDVSVILARSRAVTKINRLEEAFIRSSESKAFIYPMGGSPRYSPKAIGNLGINVDLLRQDAVFSFSPMNLVLTQRRTQGVHCVL